MNIKEKTTFFTTYRFPVVLDLGYSFQTIILVCLHYMSGTKDISHIRTRVLETYLQIYFSSACSTSRRRNDALDAFLRRLRVEFVHEMS